MPAAVTAAKRKKKAYDPWEAHFRNAIRQRVWGDAKFVAAPNQAIGATLKIIKHLNMEQCSGDAAAAKKARGELAQAKHKLTSRLLNELRSHVQGKMKKRATKVINAKEFYPTAEQVFACVKRDPNCGMRAFAFYWDIILPSAVLENDNWEKQHRWFNMISAAALNDGAPCITPETEAFAAMVYDNCLIRWIELANQKKNSTKNVCILNVDKHLDGKKTDGDTNYLTIENTPNLKPKYTIAGRGQLKMGGGWGNGIAAYKALAQEATEARELGTTLDLEQRVLWNVKEKHDIGADTTLAEWMRTKTPRRASPEPAAGVDDLWDESDDEIREVLQAGG